MRLSRLWQNSDFAILGALALTAALLHALTNSQYGFHRDELAILDDARELAWSYVTYRNKIGLDVAIEADGIEFTAASIEV